MAGVDPRSTGVVVVERRHKVAWLTFDRPARRNTLTQQTLNELAAALDGLETDDECRIVVLQGRDGFFCTGMDFAEMADRVGSDGTTAAEDVHYMDVLRRMASSSKVIVSAVDGQVMAGGVGLLAASDLVIATPASRFSLPEALWGLLPACVLPLLIRRIGFQAAYRMTLTTETWDTDQARSAGLVDEVAADLEEAIRRASVRLTRLDPETVRRMKAYFRKMWYLSDAMEEMAIAEIDALVHDPRVQDNIRQFVQHQKFPWDRRV
jgi:polyketide biosynthesis enoyl-CoA hydratase PksH